MTPDLPAKHTTSRIAPTADQTPPHPCKPHPPTFILIKFAPLSAATAFATSVLPHPGGPYSSTPDALDRPIAAKASGWAMGWLMENDSSSRTCLLGIEEGGLEVENGGKGKKAHGAEGWSDGVWRCGRREAVSWLMDNDASSWYCFKKGGIGLEECRG